VLLSFCQFAIAEDIVRRDGLSDVQGSILSGGEDGLLLSVESGNSIRIPWSTIDLILPMQSRPRLELFLYEGEQLWRAKQRLIRGDIQLSEPIFAQQFNRLRGLHGADARLATEGYLRILVARGLLQQAIHPWLETVRLHLENEPSPFLHLQPIIDEQTLLCPHLPIFELESPSLKRILQNSSSKLPSLRSLIQLLRKSSFDLSSTDSVQNVQQPLFLAQIILAANGNQEAIQSLEKRLNQLLPWQKVWAHFAIGNGYLQSKDDDIRQQGVLQLVHVASSDPTLQPWLSGAAMLQISNELFAEGLHVQAERVRHEAIRLFPTHPLVISFEENIRNSSP